MSVIFNVFRNLKNKVRDLNRPNIIENKNKGGNKNRFRNKINHASRSRSSRPFRWLMLMLAWLFGLMVMYSLGYMWIEDQDFMESIWHAWQTFTTVGYGDDPPKTTWGRIYAILVSTGGIAIVGAVFSAAFDYSHFLTDLKRSGYMKNPYADGYVIFNFPDTNLLLSFIRELRNVEPNVPICLVDNRIEELPKPLAVLPKLHFIRGNTLSEDTYRNANIRNNKTVIIFPRDPTVAESDGATKTIVNLLEDFVEKKTRIIHILVDPDNQWMFKNTRSISILESFELWAIIQECQDPYSAQIVENLLMNTRSANPKTITPKGIIGWTWGEFMQKAIMLSGQLNPEYGCTPFALVKNSEPKLCPSHKEVIDEETVISVIAYNTFDWVKFEAKMLEL